MEEKLRKIFASSLDIRINDVHDDLKYATIVQWDSIAHMALVAAIEEEFDIMMDAEDVIDMNSFSKAKEIIKKYL
ncbi:acyl carrier protein [Comamonas aquatica]|uniref:acyl carrier protein n=1 Tax=Comamonas aquatica TaxID=225991 RepID=UPI001B389D90|nr:acyl carrier protein [Comamonas aquatica]QTX20908.1 acyl carrier protein [Comamonas aquatica]